MSKIDKYRDSKFVGARGWGEKGIATGCYSVWVSFWSERNGLELDSGNGYTL